MSNLKRTSSHISMLTKGAGGSFLVKVLSAGVLFAVQIALARMLGVESYGTYIYVLTWINILAVFSKFGLDLSALRYVPRYYSQKQWGLLKGFFKYNDYTHLVFSIVVAVVLGVLVKYYFRPESKSLADTSLIACILLPLLVRMQMRGAYLQAFKRVVHAQWPELVLRPILLVAGVFFIYRFSDAGLGALSAIVINIIASLIALIILGIIYRSVLPQELAVDSERYRIGEWNRVGFTFLLLSGSEFLLHQIDIIMIGFFLGTTEAGLYAVATRLVKLLSFGLIAINSIAAPMISELYVSREKSELQRIMTIAAIGGILYFFPASLVLIIWGKALLSLFGPLFVTGYVALLILTAGRLVDSLTGLVGYLMTMTEHHKAAMIIQLFTVIVNVTLNLLLIPLYGIKGAAIATAISMVTWNVISLFYVKFALNINPTFFSRKGCKSLYFHYFHR